MHDREVERFDIGPDPAIACVFVHGRGRDAAEMKELAASLGVTGVRFLLPEATGNTWYPGSFLAPLAENEPSLSAALSHIETVVVGLLAEGFGAEQVVLGGFSQGACLCAEYLARHPRRYGGAVLFTGGLVGPPGTTWPPAPVLAGMPAYVTTSATDPFVPPERVRETGDWLRAGGASADVQIFDARDHIVSTQEIARARALFERVHGAAPVTS